MANVVAFLNRRKQASTRPDGIQVLYVQPETFHRLSSMYTILDIAKHKKSDIDVVQITYGQLVIGGNQENHIVDTSRVEDMYYIYLLKKFKIRLPLDQGYAESQRVSSNWCINFLGLRAVFMKVCATRRSTTFPIED